MRRPKLPVSSNLQCLRAKHNFNGGTYDHSAFAERVFGDLVKDATSMAPPCLYSLRGMRRHTSTASRQRKPQPRPVHRGATAGASQASMIISPCTDFSSRPKYSTSKAYWDREQTRTGKAAASLRGAQQQTRESVRKSVLPSLKCREHLIQHAPESSSYRRLQNLFVRSSPGAPRLFSTNNSPFRTPQAEAGPPTSGRSNHRSKAMLDEYITSHQQEIHSKVRYRWKRDSKDGEIKTLMKNLGRKGTITRTKFSKALDCTGDAVIIFLGPGGASESQDGDTFESASASFSQHQVVEIKIPPAHSKWVPPALAGIHLEGEEKGSVPVFDSCDEIRAKIESYLGKPNAPNKHRFCAALHAQLKVTVSKGIDNTQLKVFMAKKGSSAGARQIAYYAAYVFFEKLRIAEGRPKSLHRLEMEECHPHGLKCKRG